MGAGCSQESDPIDDIAKNLAVTGKPFSQQDENGSLYRVL